jgi:asparagine synthase (glutamine-hydrolysing)
MCGIVGIFSRARPVSEAALKRATQRLHHRGPDGQRTWISQDGRVGLGHARLSIIDLKTGDQPIASADGRTRIVVNGEFYGYEAITRELQQAGHHFRTRSDSEIALHLYRDIGPQCLHRLRGEFAFVIWDETHRTLFAARDRFGIKPLFYAFHDDTLYIASEAKALFAAGVPARWDMESLQRGIENGEQQGRTLFAGILQVPPGHYLIADDKSVRIIPYWDFDYPAASAIGPRRSDADYAAELRNAFDESVRLRLRADVPVACYLSGGLDSCAVLGMAAQHSPEPVHAFTLTFDHKDYDEEVQAKEMAAKAGARFSPVPIRQSELVDHFPQAVAHFESLCVNAHGVAKYLLSRAVRDAGYKVVLTGEGSDEIFGGYAHFRRDMLLYHSDHQSAQETARQLQALQSANGVSQGLLLPDGTAGSLEYVKRVLGFVPSWVETFSAASTKVHNLLTDEWAEHAKSRNAFQGLLNEIDVHGQLSGRPEVHQSMYLWSKTMLPNYLLCQLGDRSEMAHSIEGRVPFLDHKLVELVRSQPVDMKIRGMTEKFVLREATRDFLTDTIYHRQKHPFLSPPASLDPRGRLFMYIQDKLRGTTLSAVPIFDQKKVIRLLDHVTTLNVGERSAVDQVLMTMASICVLQDAYRPQA